MKKKAPTKRPSQRNKDENEVLRLHISLLETKPSVWRRLLVPSHFSLEALHSVFQMTMGWQMSHLYDFEIGEKRYAEPDDFDDLPSEDVKTTIGKATKNYPSFIYTYDFGDHWRHQVVVEEVVIRDEPLRQPICIGGENACPPEDCGSTGGFEELKETISDPKSEDFESMMTWLGGFYDPLTFDPNRINRDMLWMTNWKKGPNDQGLYHPYGDAE